MQTSRTLEYLFYLAVFILVLKFSEAASIDNIKSSSSSASTSLPHTSTTTEGSMRSLASGIMRSLEECKNSFSWMCFKIEFVKILESLTEREELRLIHGISIVKDPEAKEIKASGIMADVARSYPNDPNIRINGYIINKVNNFLQTHYLRVKLIDDKAIEEEARSLVETGRKDKFGKKGGFEALLAAGLMMKGTLAAIGMGAIALIAGKALMTALMALMLAALASLKHLGGGGGKSHTYEIVTKPIYTSSHSHSGHDDGGHGGSGYGGYARTLDLNLPKSLR